jgi:hypothetical protein
VAIATAASVWDKAQDGLDRRELGAGLPGRGFHRGVPALYPEVGVARAAGRGRGE